MKMSIWRAGFTGLAVLGMCSLSDMSCVTAFAATTKSTIEQTNHLPSDYQTEIVLGKKVLSHPYGFAHAGTTYMPIWYVMQALSQLGIQTTWNGKVWNMKVPATMSVDLQHVQLAKGTMQLELNGHEVEAVYGLVAIDPSSHHATTYMPIWYVMQALQRIGVQSTWAKMIWTLTGPVQKTTSTTSADGGTENAGTSASGTTGQTGTSGETSTAPVLPVHPTLPANEVSRVDFLIPLMKALQIAPDPSGTSPYDDIVAADPNWGYVHAAIEDNILQPDSTTHSGAYEAITVGMADEMYWNALGISDAAFEPGETPTLWANVIGLNPQGVAATDNLTPDEMTFMMNQITDEQQGYSEDASGLYHVVYTPENEAEATFAGDSQNGNAFYTSNTAVQNAIMEAYQFFDAMTVQNQDGTLLVTMPNLVGTAYFAYLGGAGDFSYSVDGGTSWIPASSLDTRHLALQSNGGNADATILLKIPSGTSVDISLNQLFPSIGGSVLLGEVEIGQHADGSLDVQRLNVNN